jgi:DNA-binding XRE family transcriptional regulator
MTKLEQGRATPSAELMFIIADYFDCPVEDVFTYEPEPMRHRDHGSRTAPGGKGK